MALQLSETQAQRARFIRTVLAWHGAGQADLGRAIGCTQQAASLKLAGKRRFSDDELLRVAEVFGLDPGLLLRPPALAGMLGDPVHNSAPALLPSTYRCFRRSAALSSLRSAARINGPLTLRDSRPHVCVRFNCHTAVARHRVPQTSNHGARTNVLGQRCTGVSASRQGTTDAVRSD